MEETELNFIKVRRLPCDILTFSNCISANKRGRAHHGQQEQLRISVSPDRLLPNESPYQIAPHVLCTSKFRKIAHCVSELTFLKAGTSREEDSYKADASLSEQGKEYARKMSETLLKYREEEANALRERGGTAAPLKSLAVWTSTRRRTIETSQYLGSLGFMVRQRAQMSQLNPGVCEQMSERRIRAEFPDEVEKHEADPYHHRYPRAEVSEAPNQRVEHAN